MRCLRRWERDAFGGSPDCGSSFGCRDEGGGEEVSRAGKWENGRDPERDGRDARRVVSGRRGCERREVKARTTGMRRIKLRTM